MATTKTAPAKKADELALTAYNMKTKEKGVTIQDPVIVLKGGKYLAMGHDGEGNKLTTILNEAKAKACIEKGIATAGEGLVEKPKKKK